MFDRRRSRVPTNAFQADIRGCPIGARTPQERSSVRTQSPLFRASTPLQRSSPCRPAFRWSVSFPIVWHRNPDPAFCRATPHDQPHTVTISEIYFGIRSIRKAALKWQFESTRSQVLDKSQGPPLRGTRPQALLRPAQRPTARAESAKLLRGLAPAPPNISPE